MRKKVTTGWIVGLLVVGLSVAWAGGITWRYKVDYTGTWDIQPNGDVKVVRTFTVPAMMYANWKASNIHMKEMRNFNPAVSTVAVDDLAFKWDDVKRTLTLTMTVRGLMVNKGDHWEGEMSEGLKFSNINQGEKKAYFHASVVSAQITVDGQDIVSFPAAATDIRNDGSRLLRYKLAESELSGAGSESPMSEAQSAGGGATPLWWALFGVTLVAGLALVGVSMRAPAKKK